MDQPVSQLQPATFAEFREDSKRGNVVAVTRTVAIGSIDPIDAFVNVSGDARNAFLLESVEGGEIVAKYSFLGADPYMIVRGEGEETTIERDGVSETRSEGVTEYLRRHFQQNKLASRSDLGPLAGGAVGYLGYGAAKWFERALKNKKDSEAHRPDRGEDAVLMFYRTLVVFDRVQQQLRIVSVAFTGAAGSNEGLRELYDQALNETERTERLLTCPARPQSPIKSQQLHPKTAVRSNWPREDFQNAVREVKEHIMAGDCYQVVLSQRFSKDVTVGPVPIYRALRQSNPAPYTYLLKMGEEAIVGASPE
ncbi:MAG: chorismate-binding protein, partial [Acidobacteria bacterium]|nr:chorismate-binding protein [Acidobacteriota bacterium]